jgi:hypothetical protein
MGHTLSGMIPRTRNQLSSKKQTLLIFLSNML